MTAKRKRHFDFWTWHILSSTCVHTKKRWSSVSFMEQPIFEKVFCQLSRLSIIILSQHNYTIFCQLCFLTLRTGNIVENQMKSKQSNKNVYSILPACLPDSASLTSTFTHRLYDIEAPLISQCRHGMIIQHCCSFYSCFIFSKIFILPLCSRIICSLLPYYLITYMTVYHTHHKYF